MNLLENTNLIKIYVFTKQYKFKISLYTEI